MDKETDLGLWFPALILLSEHDNIRRTLIVLFVISLLASLMSIVFAYPFLMIIGATEEASIFKESDYGSAGAMFNTIIMLASVITVTIMVLYLIRKRKIKILKIFWVLVIAYISGNLAMIFIPIALYVYIWLMVPFILDIISCIYLPLSITIGLIFSVLAIFSLLKIELLTIRNTILFIIAVLIGVLLGTSLGRLTPLVLLIAFIVYDLYTVYAGPLGEIVKEFPHDNTELAIRPLMIGLGDIAFYALPVAYSLAYYDLITTILVLCSISIGFLIDAIVFIKKLQQEEKSDETIAMPALPIPLSFALSVLVLRMFL